MDETQVNLLLAAAALAVASSPNANNNLANGVPGAAEALPAIVSTPAPTKTRMTAASWAGANPNPNSNLAKVIPPTTRQKLDQATAMFKLQQKMGADAKKQPRTQAPEQAQAVSVFQAATGNAAPQSIPRPPDLKCNQAPEHQANTCTPNLNSNANHQEMASLLQKMFSVDQLKAILDNVLLQQPNEHSTTTAVSATLLQAQNKPHPKSLSPTNNAIASLKTSEDTSHLQRHVQQAIQLQAKTKHQWQPQPLQEILFDAQEKVKRAETSLLLQLAPELLGNNATTAARVVTPVGPAGTGTSTGTATGHGATLPLPAATNRASALLVTDFKLDSDAVSSNISIKKPPSSTATAAAAAFPTSNAPPGSHDLLQLLTQVHKQSQSQATAQEFPQSLLSTMLQKAAPAQQRPRTNQVSINAATASDSGVQPPPQPADLMQGTNVEALASLLSAAQQPLSPTTPTLQGSKQPVSTASVGVTVVASAGPAPLVRGKKRRRGRTGTFPQKLHKMLEDMELNRTTHIASFLGASSTFAVHRPVDFAETIMPRYFKMGSFASFQRQLNLYDFVRVNEGPDRGAYHHTQFVRGKPLLSTMMRRTKTKGLARRAAAVAAGSDDDSDDELIH